MNNALDMDPASVADELDPVEREVLFALCRMGGRVPTDQTRLEQTLACFAGLGIVECLSDGRIETWVALPFGWRVAYSARGPLQ